MTEIGLAAFISLMLVAVSLRLIMREQQWKVEQKEHSKTRRELNLVRRNAKTANNDYHFNKQWLETELKKTRRASEKRRKRIQRALNRSATRSPNATVKAMRAILRGEMDGQYSTPPSGKWPYGLARLKEDEEGTLGQHVDIKA